MTRPVLSDEARRFLDAERVARLATADARGRPHLVPVVYALQGDRVFIPIDRKTKKHADPRALRRVRNLCENPRASLLVDHYEEDWAGWPGSAWTGRPRCWKEGRPTGRVPAPSP